MYVYAIMNSIDTSNSVSGLPFFFPVVVYVFLYFFNFKILFYFCLTSSICTSYAPHNKNKEFWFTTTPGISLEYHIITQLVYSTSTYNCSRITIPACQLSTLLPTIWLMERV